MKATENRIKVVVYPSAMGDDSLTVADAMQQVLDYFALLSKAEAKDSGSAVRVVWRLESATTNSPFTVEASAVSSDPEVSVERRALNARNALQDGLGKLLRGEAKPLWFDSDAEVVMRRIIVRNLNGIGRTDIIADLDTNPIILDHRAARKAQIFLDLKAAEEAAQIEDLSRKEYGSVEGQATGLTTHYAKPALLIRERLSGREIKCVLPAADAAAIGAQHQWNEVWGNQRVIVTGVCHYEKSGNLVRVDALDISGVKNRDVPLSEIRDPNFSAGLSPQEHLDLMWGHEHG
jgi:hypothetical protein